MFPVIGFHILIERIEAGSNRTVLSNQFDIGTNSVRQSHFFRPCGCFIVPFPQGQDKRFDTFLFLDVKYPILYIERIERYRVFSGIGKVNPIFPVRFPVYHFTQSQVTVSGINQQDVRILFVILAHHVIGEE